MLVYLTGQCKSRLIRKSNIVLKLRISGDSVHYQIVKFYATIKIIVRFFNKVNLIRMKFIFFQRFMR